MGKWEKSHYVASGKRGYWSKYGDGKRWKEEVEEEGNWVCQSCSQPQYEFIPSFSIKLDDDENLRVCALCHHVASLNQLLDFASLLSRVRPRNVPGNALANLLTLPIV